MYDLIVLKSVCTVIQEYCRRKYCVLISYDLKWEELAMIVCVVTNWGLVARI